MHKNDIRDVVYEAVISKEWSQVSSLLLKMHPSSDTNLVYFPLLYHHSVTQWIPSLVLYKALTPLEQIYHFSLENDFDYTRTCPHVCLTLHGYENSSCKERMQCLVSEMISKSFEKNHHHASRRPMLEEEGSLWKEERYRLEISTIFTCLVLNNQSNTNMEIKKWIDLWLEMEDMGIEILTRVIWNVPDLLTTVLECIVEKKWKSLGKTVYPSNILSIIEPDCTRTMHEVCLRTSTLYPSYGKTIRTYLHTQGVLPAVVLELTLTTLMDPIPFLLQTMTNIEIEKTHGRVLWNYIRQRAQEDGAEIKHLHATLFHALESACTALSTQTLTDLKQVTQLLRCYAALMGLSHYMIQGNELMRMITLSTMAAQYKIDNSKIADLDFIQTSFATILLGCTVRSEVLVKSRDNTMELIKNCLRALYDNGSAKSTFVLTSIHFCANQSNQVVLAVQKHLQSPIAIDIKPLVDFGEYLIKPMFPEAVMVKETLAQPAMKGLSSTLDSVLISSQLKCVQTLLSTKSFLNSKMDPQDWILQLVQTCSLPIHALLPSLMMEYAQCVCASMNENDGNGSLKSISFMTIKVAMAQVEHLVLPIKLHEVSSQEQQQFLTASLYTVYLLHFNARCRFYPKAAQIAMNEYPTFTFPIRVLLQISEANSEPSGLCHALHPILLKLVQDECPEAYSSSLLIKIPKVVMDMDLKTFTAVLDKTYVPTASISSFYTALCMLQGCSTARLVTVFQKVVTAWLPRMLENSFEWLQEPLLQVWDRVKVYHNRPDTLYVHVANSLMQSTDTSKRQTVRVLTFYDFREEPHCLFQCDERIFSNPLLLRWCLEIVHHFQKASKNGNDREIQRETVRLRHVKIPCDEPETSPECTQRLFHIVLLQNCVICHCMLDIITEYGSSLAIQKVVYKHLDTLFCNDIMLLKYVTQQGYCHELCSGLMENVSSMKHCVTFLPDLLKGLTISNSASEWKFMYKLISCLAITHSNTASSSSLQMEIEALIQYAIKVLRNQLSEYDRFIRGPARSSTQPVIVPDRNTLATLIDVTCAIASTVHHIPSARDPLLKGFRKIQTLVQHRSVHDRETLLKALQNAFYEILHKIHL